jgi:hypothetical protein
MNTSTLPAAFVLRPVRRWWLRMLIFLLIIVFPVLSHAELYKKLIFAAAMAAWLGSYPLSCIRGEHFQRIMFIMFMPARTKRWSLDRFVSIQTECDPQDELAGAWWFIFGNWYVLWAVLDWMIPWLRSLTRRLVTCSFVG